MTVFENRMRSRRRVRWLGAETGPAPARRVTRYGAGVTPRAPSVFDEGEQTDSSIHEVPIRDKADRWNDGRWARTRRVWAGRAFYGYFLWAERLQAVSAPVGSIAVLPCSM
jgi:hypothetical protein